MDYKCLGLNLFILILATIPHFAYGCTYLTAYFYGENSFESHHFYNTFDYDNYMDECWVITANDPGDVVKIWSEDFELEGNDFCNYDYVQLYDGDSPDYTNNYVKYCGKGSFTIVSSSDQVYVLFNTDGSHTYPGFKINYQAVSRSEYNAYRNSWNNQAHNLWEGLRWWHILLIVLGVLTFFVILCVVVTMVVSFACILKRGGTKGSVISTGTGATTGMQQQQGLQGNTMNQGAYYNQGTGGVTVQPSPNNQPGQAVNMTPLQQQAMGGYVNPVSSNEPVDEAGLLSAAL